jgi:hypothetical protein
MPNRLIRKTAILAKKEVTYGTDPVPTGGANAMLVSNLSINPINAQNVARDIIRPYLGGSEELIGTRYVEMGFFVELAGAGTVAVAPAWAPLLEACGFNEVLTATIRADYVPVSDSLDSLTIYWYDDGVLHTATGCRGTATIMLKVGERPGFQFQFTGLYNTPTEDTAPALTLTAWKTPQVVTDQFTGDLTFGATHNAVLAPAFTGGTVYPSQGLELDLTNSVNFTPLLGGETVDLTQRDVKGKVTLDVTAAQEVALLANVEAATLTSLGLIHGTLSNRRVGVFMPTVQLINPQKAELNGKRMISYDLRVVPSAGDDEIRIIASF